MKTLNEKLIPQPSKGLPMKEYAEEDTLSPAPPPPPLSSTLQRKEKHKRGKVLLKFKF